MHGELVGQTFQRMIRILALDTWSAFLLSYGTPPISDQHKLPLLQDLTLLLQRLGSEPSTQISVWLQVLAFPPDDTAQLVSRYGREWRPQMGMGVWPDREPPRTWRPSDFTDRDWGTPLPPLMDSVLHLAGDRQATLHAWSSLFGTGSTMLMLLEGSAPTFHDRVREQLASPIVDPALQHKAFYVPLLDATSVSTLRHTLSDLLPGTSLYLRESKEDNGVLILLRTSDVEGLTAAGLFPMLV